MPAIARAAVRTSIEAGDARDTVRGDINERLDGDEILYTYTGLQEHILSLRCRSTGRRG